MINIDVLREINKLTSIYEERWGKEIDYNGMPTHITQERLLLALRYAVKTGDSALVSLQKIRDITNEYYDYLKTQHKINNWTLANGYIFDKPCPLCGNKVKYISSGNSYLYTCETEHCFRSAFRGI